MKQNDDPIVAEVRATRARFNAEANYDSDVLAARAHEAMEQAGLHYCNLRPVTPYKAAA